MADDLPEDDPIAQLRANAGVAVAPAGDDAAPGGDAGGTADDRIERFNRVQDRVRDDPLSFLRANAGIDVEAAGRRDAGEEELRDWRGRVANSEENWNSWLGRNVNPFLPIKNDILYDRARRRMEAGQSQPGDAELMATQERLRELDAHASTGEQIGAGVAHIPALVVEGWSGGRLLRAAGVGLGGLTGAGAAAGETAAPGVLGRLGTTLIGEAGGGSLASRVGGVALRGTLSTPAMPSLYGDQIIHNNIAAGRDALDLRGVPAALGVAAVQNIVLGSLGHYADGLGSGVPGFVGRQAIRAGAGVVEQQGADVLTSGVQDLLGDHAQRQTGYGILGDLWRGQNGQALQHLAVQTATFAAFGAVHEAQHPGHTDLSRVTEGRQYGPLEREAPEQVLTAFSDALGTMARRGMSRDAATGELQHINDTLNGALQENPNLTRDQARDLFDRMPDGPQRDYAAALAETMPERAATTPEAPPAAAEAAPQAPAQPATPAETPTGQPGPGERAAPARAAEAPLTADQHRDIALSIIGTGKIPAEHADTALGRSFERAADMGYPRDYKTLQRAVFVDAAARHGAEAAEFARKFPARPPAAGAEATAPRAGVGDVVRSVFPEAQEMASGAIRTTIGDRTLDMRVDPARNAVRLDFGWTAPEKAGVAGNLQKGSLEVFRTIRKLADKLKEAGTSIEYTANDAHAGAYERMLRTAGYEQVAGPTGARGSLETRTWQPAAERSAEWQAKYQDLRSKGISDAAARGTADLLYPTERAAQGQQPGSPMVERRGPQRPPQGVWDHIKAEHPDWNVEQIGREAARRADQLMVDPQTGLGSRSQFSDDAKSGRHGQHVSIYDVPSMHEVNNHFGDQAGDALLAAHGAAMREAGIEHGYRKGGDELGAFFHSPQEQAAAGERYHDILRNTEVIWTDANGNMVRVKGFGVARAEGANLQEAQAKLPAAKETASAEGYRSRGPGQLPPGLAFEAGGPGQAPGSNAERGRGDQLPAAQRQDVQSPGQQAALERQLKSRGVNPRSVEARVQESGATNAAEWDAWAKKNNAYATDPLKHQYARLLADQAGHAAAQEHEPTVSEAARLKQVKDQASAMMEEAQRQMRTKGVPHAIERDVLGHYNELLRMDPEAAHSYSEIMREVFSKDRVHELGAILASPEFRKVIVDAANESAKRIGLSASSVYRSLDARLQKDFAGLEVPAPRAGAVGPTQQPATSAGPTETTGAGQADSGALPPAAAVSRQAGGHELTPEQWAGLSREDKLLLSNPRAHPLLKDALIRQKIYGAQTLLSQLPRNGISSENELFQGAGKEHIIGGLLPKSLFKKGGVPLDQVADGLARSYPEAFRGDDGRHEERLIELLAQNHLIDTGRWIEKNWQPALEDAKERFRAEFTRQNPGATEAETESAFEASLRAATEDSRRETGTRPPGDVTSEASSQDLAAPGGQVPATHVNADGNLVTDDGQVLFGPGATATAPGRATAPPGPVPGSGPGQSPPGGGPTSGTGSAAGGGPGRGRGVAPGPFELIATIKRLFHMPVYVESHLQANASALYRVKPEAAEVQKMAAGAAPYYLHELFHHLEKTQGLNLDPTSMPRDVLTGLRQFDYQPGRQNLRVAAKEGGAEWLRMRETGTMQPRTPEQRAAADYLENMLAKRKGVLDKLDRVRDLFADFAAQKPSEQFGGLLSKTGEPAKPEVTAGETAATFLQQTRQAMADNYLDDAMPAKRAESAAQARGEVFEPGKKLSEVIATTRLRNVPDANEMEQGGVFAYDANGKHRVLSKPLGEAIKGLSAEEVAPSGELDRYMHALRILHDHTTDAVQRSPEQLEGARNTIKEYMQNPDKFLRLETAAQNVTNIFNSTLDAMVLSGRITRERAEYLKAKHPFYVSEQHITEPDFRSVAPFGGRRKGEEPRVASFLRQRTGSGEQMVSWLDALRDRFRFTSSMVNDQAKFRALLDLSQREGVGEWLNPGQPGEGPGAAPEGWPKDGTKPSITGYVEGEPVTVRVNDRSFYEMVTGTQGEGGRVQPFFKSLGDVLQATRIPQMVRTGGTIMNPLWHLKNFIRDPILYAQRTIADKGTIRNLGDLFNWYGKSLSFYSRALLAGGADRVEVTRASDNYFKLMERMSGRELSFGAESGRRTFASRVMDGWHGLFQRISDLVTAGEKGTRVLELRNVLDKLGITEDWITKEMARDPSQRNPIPFAAQVAALDIASQITHNVHQQGVYIRQLNRSWPFLGAHIAGVYKDIANAVAQPTKVMGALSILAMAKSVEWLVNKDDKEWQELPDHYRFGFSFRTPLGWMHLPAPRGLTGMITGVVDNAMRASSASNPRFGPLLSQSLQELAPHGGPEPANTLAHVVANRSWNGRPIIPDREADRMSMTERLTDPRGLAYAGSQLTGGMLDPHRLSANPFAMDQHPHQAVEDYYSALHAADNAMAPARHGMRVAPEVVQRFQRLHAVEQAMKTLGLRYRTASPEAQGTIRAQQNELARRALQAAGR